MIWLRINRGTKNIFMIFFASVNGVLCLGLKVNFVWDCEFGFTLVLEELVISLT